MAAINPQWHRWIYASVAKHMHAEAAPLPVVVEFLDKRDPVWEAANSKAEVTITGPMTKEISKGCHRIWLDVFVVLTSHRTSNDYDHIDHAGTLANALDQCIICKSYGETIPTDIGTLTPRPEDSDTIEVVHLKPKAEDSQIHSTIAARFRGYFTEQ